MVNKPNSEGGHDLDTHHLLELREPGANLRALREELQYHPDITAAAVAGQTFEECLAIIGIKLDIALDGDYDVEDLCGVLVSAMRNRRFHPGNPSLRAAGLVDIEMVETSDSISVVHRDRSIETTLPKDAILVETNKPSPIIALENFTQAGRSGSSELDAGSSLTGTLTSVDSSRK
jgi:hypothetical protein